MTDSTDLLAPADLVNRALAFGFSHAATMDPSSLRVRDEVREMCSADRCNMYNRCWSCPPACAPLAENQAILATYRTGLIVQTTGQLEDPYDWDAMVALGDAQAHRLRRFRRVLQPDYRRLLTLGNGACTICAECTYPQAPCRLPDQLILSMEAFGLVVSDVCRANQLGYYYGPGTLTYTGCYLLD